MQLFRSRLPEGQVIGFVPTMGALHRGHLSLVDKADAESDLVFVSIFVNPNQFNDPEDLRNYPRIPEKDLELLAGQGKTTVVFMPDVKDIYPEPDTRTFDFGHLDKVMEGAHRPGHFNGVAQVVSRLFNIVNPHKAFFGEKDFQQLAVIRKMTLDLNFNIEIIPCPIIREPDGLAMSSRNTLLTAEERIHASKISEVLLKTAELSTIMDADELTSWALRELNSDKFIKTEYFQIVNSFTLLPVSSLHTPEEKHACTAVKIGKIRLIDNIKIA